VTNLNFHLSSVYWPYPLPEVHKQGISGTGFITFSGDYLIKFNYYKKGSVNYSFWTFVFNTLWTDRQHIGFWLLKVVDWAPNIWLLGHAMLQNGIHCSGAMQTHNLCVVFVPNVLFSSQKRDLSVFLSYSEGKCLQAMPLLHCQLHVPDS
jgi:hypothetical protein